MIVFNHCAVLAFVTIFSFYDQFEALDSSCGDWYPLKDEKCLKIFDKVGLQTYEDAEKTCHQQDNESSLLIIRFREEQQSILEFLKTNKFVDNVWIGVKYSTDKYKLSDDSDLQYTNWAEGSPKNKSDHCVQIQSDEAQQGKWSDAFCTKKNLVVCQKMQTWSLAHLQKVLLNTIKNPFPIGFIYVQLPKEKSPSDIWPWMSWKDVSTDYAGLFFRADGGTAATFGQIQQEDSPRLSQIDVSIHDSSDAPAEKNYYNKTIVKGQWSEPMRTGKNEFPLRFYRFLVSDVEIRPRNTAIRIWKRTE